MLKNWFLLFLVLSCTVYNVRAEDDDAEEESASVPRDIDSMKIDGLSDEETKALNQNAESNSFGAQTDRMMKLIIHSLYKKKDIFLRELISNASDALDKIRLLSLSNAEELGEKEDLDIKIKADTENNILHITDSGVGMTKEHLKKYLGTIAKSGTADVFEQVEKAEGSQAVSDLIGQFGVGFYSSFLVADRVMVTSKHNDDDQYIWMSDAGAEYQLIKDPRGNTLGRGTTISLYLKEEAQDYLNGNTLKDLIQKYSQFINFPIYLWETTTVDEEVPIEEEEAVESDEEEVEADDEEGEVEDGDDEEDDKPKTKTVKKEVSDFSLQNTVKPIWIRPTSEVEDSEYDEFFKSISKTSDEPMNKVHFSAEGEVSFKSILFIPKTAARDLYTDYGGKKSTAIKMYVRRVFITDDFSNMMPRYLNWLVGVVDSDDLPLNVSREQLQQDKLLKVIKKKLVRKALDMIKKLDEDDFKKFWEQFGTSIKLGVIEDSTNRNRLAKLLRFHSSNSDELTSLEEYVERMKENQQKIYFVGANGLEECKKSPFSERLIKKGYEVIYLAEPVDEYAIQALPEFDGKRFQNVAKEGLDIDQSSKAKKAMEDYKEEFEPLTKWLADKALKDKISKVEISERLENTPAALVASSYGWSGNMQRIMEAQAYKSRADTSQDFYSKQKKNLEINPRHPLVKALLEKVRENEDDETAIRNAELMFDTAALRSDYKIADDVAFADRILSIMYENLGVDAATAEVEEEPEDIDEDDEEEEDDAEELDADEEDDDEVEYEEADEVDDQVEEDTFEKDEL